MPSFTRLTIYKGDNNDVMQGTERVVYYWKTGDFDYQGKPECAILRDHAPCQRSESKFFCALHGPS